MSNFRYACRRKIAVWFLFMFCTIGLLAIPATAATKTKVNFWIYAVPAQMSRWVEDVEKIINAKFPDIELDIQLCNWYQVREQVFVAIAAGIGPDLSYFPSNIFPMLVGNGAALPIDNYWEKWSLRTDFIPDVIYSLTFDGKIYGLPMMVWPLYDLYNLDVLDASGVLVPGDWDGLLSAVRKLTRYGQNGQPEVLGYWTTKSPAYATYDLHLSMEQLGSRLIGWNDKQVNINNPIGLQALQHQANLYQAGMPPGRAVQTATYQSLINGKVAIMHPTDEYLATFDFGNVRAEPKRIVGPNAGKDIVQHCTGVIYMVQGTKNPDAAWRVMQEFFSGDYLAEYYKSSALNYFPTRKSFIAKRYFNNHPLTPKTAGLLESPITTFGARHFYFTEFHNRAGELFINAMVGVTGAQQALEEGERLINAILAEKYANNQVKD